MRSILAADQVDEVVGGEVAFLAEEDVDDEVALAGALAAGRAQAVDVGGGGVHDVSASLPAVSSSSRVPLDARLTA